MMHALALQSCMTPFCLVPIENTKASGETQIVAPQRGYAWTQPVLQQTGSKSTKPSLQLLNHHWAWMSCRITQLSQELQTSCPGQL